MTPQERAKEIFTYDPGCGCCCYKTQQQILDFIAAQIEEAEREAVEDCLDGYGVPYQIKMQGFKEGAEAMRELAAKAVSDLWSRGSSHTAQSFVDGCIQEIHRLPDHFQKQEEVPKKCGCGLSWSTIHRFDGPCYVMDKPTPEPEKGEHSDFSKGHLCTICKPGFIMSKPKDEVEEKIKELIKSGRRTEIDRCSITYDVIDFERAMREFVELARKR